MLEALRHISAQMRQIDKNTVKLQNKMVSIN
jgi:hypothetical protein